MDFSCLWLLLMRLGAGSLSEQLWTLSDQCVPGRVDWSKQMLVEMPVKEGQDSCGIWLLLSFSFLKKKKKPECNVA